MDRMLKVKQLENHPFEKKLFSKLNTKDKDFINGFISANESLDKNAWSEKVNRLFLNGDKPKNHSTIWAILISIS